MAFRVIIFYCRARAFFIGSMLLYCCFLPAPMHAQSYRLVRVANPHEIIEANHSRRYILVVRHAQDSNIQASYAWIGCHVDSICNSQVFIRKFEEQARVEYKTDGKIKLTRLSYPGLKRGDGVADTIQLPDILFARRGLFTGHRTLGQVIGIVAICQTPALMLVYPFFFLNYRTNFSPDVYFRILGASFALAIPIITTGSLLQSNEFSFKNISLYLNNPWRLDVKKQ